MKLLNLISTNREDQPQWINDETTVVQNAKKADTVCYNDYLAPTFKPSNDICLELFKTCEMYKKFQNVCIDMSRFIYVIQWFLIDKSSGFKIEAQGRFPTDEYLSETAVVEDDNKVNAFSYNEDLELPFKISKDVCLELYNTNKLYKKISKHVYCYVSFHLRQLVIINDKNSDSKTKNKADFQQRTNILAKPIAEGSNNKAGAVRYNNGLALPFNSSNVVRVCLNFRKKSILVFENHGILSSKHFTIHTFRKLWIYGYQELRW